MTLPGNEAADVPEAVADASEEKSEPEPAVSQQPAQETVEEEEPTAVEQPEVVVVEPGPPLVPLPEFDEADLIHGGTGSRGAILAGRGIVPSSGAAAQTDWVLLIPSARIKASIVRVGLAPGNAFGSPDNPEVIGWWESGPAPGQAGNVLLDGHRDFSDLNDNLGTGVCWSLPNTEIGDAILVRDDAASVYYVYEVIETVAVAWNDADAVSYLQPTDDARLTLITCEGSFDKDAHNYSNRRIVVAVMMGVAEF
ncbi:MAG: class F sortase [Chloroflexi bacterium]|nr:class F sortase [Chloroflexota bacterium]